MGRESRLGYGSLTVNQILRGVVRFRPFPPLLILNDVIAYESLMNTKKLGDIGLAQAIAFYAMKGWTVSLPLTDSQDYDLIVDDGEILQKVQVKYTSYQRSGNYQASIAVKGGTKGGTIKKASDVIFDRLFVAADNGDRWCIPRSALKGVAILNSSMDEFKVS